jgi:hypothetical protein
MGEPTAKRTVQKSSRSDSNKSTNNKSNIRALKTNCKKQQKTKWEAEPALFIV